MPEIYVLNKDGSPLMPSHSYDRIRRLLHSHKARIVDTKPLTIQLTYQIEEPALTPCILGIDPGRTSIGVCAIDQDGGPMYAAQVEIRNRETPKLIADRTSHRRASRRDERKVRQRRAISFSKIGMARVTEYWCMLIGQKKSIRCKVIWNQEAYETPPEHIGRLSVRKSIRSYNNTKRGLLGTSYNDHGHRFVLRATQTNGTKLHVVGEDMEYHKARNCKSQKGNTGQVYI